MGNNHQCFFSSIQLFSKLQLFNMQWHTQSDNINVIWYEINRVIKCVIKAAVSSSVWRTGWTLWTSHESQPLVSLCFINVAIQGFSERWWRAVSSKRRLNATHFFYSVNLCVVVVKEILLRPLSEGYSGCFSSSSLRKPNHRPPNALMHSELESVNTLWNQFSTSALLLSWRRWWWTHTTWINTLQNKSGARSQHRKH